MFATLLQELRGYFGRAFVLGAFLPTAVFVGTNVALGLEIGPGLSRTSNDWNNLSGTLKGLAILAVFVVLIVVAYVLYSLQYVVTRLFEGYWPRHLRRIRNWRAAYHLSRWRSLDERAAQATPVEANEIYAEQLAYYPPRTHLDKMMPTRLGNILRAAELYAYDRYGIDSAIIWTRLRPLLKPEATASLESWRLVRDFMLLVCTFSGVFSVVWCPLLALKHRWVLCLISATGLLVAFMCYSVAVQSAVAYAEQLRAIFDLHRHRLLEALRRPIPVDAAAERLEWLRLSRFFYRNLPLPTPAPAPAKSAAPELAAKVIAWLEEIASSKGTE